MLHSPLPWTLVPSPIPYYTWIMDATGGCVCIGFGATDQDVLLSAPLLLAALHEAVVAMDQGQIVTARAVLVGAMEKAQGCAV